jgi:hypothetical protein
VRLGYIGCTQAGIWLLVAVQTILVAAFDFRVAAATIL